MWVVAHRVSIEVCGCGGKVFGNWLWENKGCCSIVKWEGDLLVCGSRRGKVLERGVGVGLDGLGGLVLSWCKLVGGMHVILVVVVRIGVMG
jgi:hypothetical protein